MKIAIILSAPSLRQVFRGNDPRAVSVVTERTLWPLLEAGDDVSVEVQCDDVANRRALKQYFAALVADEKAFLASQANVRKAGDSAKA